MRFVVEGVGLTAGGGKELAVTLLSHMLAHREHEFLLVVPDLPDYAHFEGTNVSRVPYPTGRSLPSRYWFLSRALPSICSKAKADALLCLGNFAPRKPPCPTVGYVHNPWLVFPAPDPARKRTLRERLVIRYGRNSLRHLSPLVHIVVQTPRMKERMASVFSLSPERITVVPGALLEESNGSGPAATHSRRDNPFTFLCLARYYTHKNLEVLAEAMKRLPGSVSEDAKCVITISPEQHPGARRLLGRIEDERLNGRIVNIGPVSAKERLRVYRSADAFVLPTLLETFSFTYLEAMHFGLPILTSDRDFAHDRCRDAAIYFDPLDAGSVANAMARVMQNRELRQTLVENGRRVLAEAPTWDEIAGQFVDLLERAARGELPRGNHQGSRVRPAKGSTALPWSAAGGRSTPIQTRQSVTVAPTAAELRTYFDQEAATWQGKYRSGGKLQARLERFTARLEELLPPPGRILDFGCGTGDLAAALSALGYGVTACDIAEKMLEAAREAYAEAGVEWRRLEPAWRELPFPAGRFDGAVASSVFEYLEAVPGVAAELARVLRPGGVLLLSVPNPYNRLRKLEAGLKSLRRLPAWLERIPRVDSYATYLRLSRNRWGGAGWQTALSAADFAAVDERDFSEQAWRAQARASLVILALKKRVA